MAILLLLESIGGATAPPSYGPGKAMVLPRFKWEPSNPRDTVRTELTYQCMGALQIAINPTKIHGPAFDFPDYLVVECRYALMDVGVILILMPRTHVVGFVSIPPNSDLLGRKGTTFLCYPPSLEYLPNEPYFGGWMTVRFRPGWTLGMMEEDLIEEQKNNVNVKELLEKWQDSTSLSQRVFFNYQSLIKILKALFLTLGISRSEHQLNNVATT